VSADSPSPAEATEGYLQAGIRRGVPVAIPGAREPNAPRPAVEPAPPTEAAVSLTTPPKVEDRRQIEYEFEGGGAPNERRNGAQRTNFEKLRDWLLRRRS
jgi:hypothetical protein